VDTAAVLMYGTSAIINLLLFKGGMDYSVWDLQSLTLICNLWAPTESFQLSSIITNHGGVNFLFGGQDTGTIEMFSVMTKTS